MSANKKTILTAAGIILLGLITITGCQGAEKTGDKKVIQTDEKVKLQQEVGGLKTENVVAGQAIKAYEKSVSDLRGSLGIIIGLVVAFVGVIAFKNTREYREAIQEAKEAAKEAKDAAKEVKETAKEAAKEAKETAKEAVGWVEKARQKYEDMENKGDKIIKDIVSKAEVERQKSQKEAEKQRKIFELWNKGLRAYSEGKYEDSYACWQEIISIKPDIHEIWYNWGLVLSGHAQTKEGAEADRLFVQACEKYQKALEINPKIADAWNNWGAALLGQARKKEGAEADRLFAEAYTKYQKAIEVKSDYSYAWNNWGNALLGQAQKKEGAEADRLFAEAYTKYQKAIELKPDMHEAWKNWGSALLYQAQKKEGQEKQKLIQEAKEKCLRAEQIKKGEGAYNLACAAAIEGNEEECKKWLKAGEEAGTLRPREHAMKDDDLKAYWNKDWFKAIKWKGEK